MNSARLQTVGTVVVAVALLAAAGAVQAARERAYPPSLDDDQQDAVLMTSGRALRHLTASLNALAADVYWIRTIQYYGGAKRGVSADPLHPEPPPFIALNPKYDQLYTLLDLTTTLDPRFDIAYRFGAVFLAEAYPSGAGRPDLAVRLLEKGLQQRPDKWEYMEDIGFVYYWFVHDYRQAATWFERASGVPGAPNWLKPLAATTLAQGGDRKSSRLMWEEMRQSAEVDWLRAAAEHRLLQLRALDEIDALEVLTGRYTQQAGGPPGDWLALVRAGIIPGIPVDPAGVRYQLLLGGHVTLSPASPLNPLPVEPERTGAAGPS